MAWVTRFLTAVAFLAIGVIFSPETFGSKSDGQNSPVLITGLKLAHLLCFSTAWGAALWVTFIGGIIMFNNKFAEASIWELAKQDVPSIFLHGGCMLCSGGRVIWILAPLEDVNSYREIPAWVSASCLYFQSQQSGYLYAHDNRMMKQRHKIEREANIGDEVGWTKNKEAAKKNPKLASMNKKFGMIHGLSSLANIFAFGSLAIHSWYLAGKLNL
ncbi:hypothetical protein CASFOL_002597 [Castilleja foliolosa]|uniref:DUF4149 domain-containing protein n=1 Tax=Castilleja foliolosa TaxID=1961234 RepID=A0ABD3EI84_9LAMI